MEQTQYDAIIIGSGHNGLVTAGYLAEDGLSVLMLERQDVVGGAIVTEELYPGFFVPYCAYVVYLLQGKVIDDLKLREYGLDIIPPSHGLFRPFPDGKHMSLGFFEGHNEDLTQIAAFSPHDAEIYPQWEEFWERASGILHRYWLQDPPTLAQVSEDLRGTRDEEIWETMLTVSNRDLVERYFESEQMKGAHISTVGEGDPSAPGSIVSIAYEHCSTFSRTEDIGIPRGGIGQITQAMASSARDRGVEIRTGVKVDKVIVEDGMARGVVLDSGEEIRSFITVSNADPKSTYLSLVDAEHLDEGFTRKVENLSTEGNAVKFLAALREMPDFSAFLGEDYDPREAAMIEICPSAEYAQQSWDDAKNGRLTNSPIMDIQIPSAYDPSLAPPGHHVLSCWTNYYPAHPAEGPWDAAMAKRVGEQIIDAITEYAPNFRDSLVDWTAQSPKDIEIREGMTDGNIRHIDINSRQIFSGRMPYRSPIERLYLCGAGTHPGGNITGAPGHNAAKAILKDLAKVVV